MGKHGHLPEALVPPWGDGYPYCEKCKRPGMRALYAAGRQLAETFAGERLDKIENAAAQGAAPKELREASLDWIEFHTERRLSTRALLETT